MSTEHVQSRRLETVATAPCTCAASSVVKSRGGGAFAMSIGSARHDTFEMWLCKESDTRTDNKTQLSAIQDRLSDTESDLINYPTHSACVYSSNLLLLNRWPSHAASEHPPVLPSSIPALEIAFSFLWFPAEETQAPNRLSNLQKWRSIPQYRSQQQAYRFIAIINPQIANRPYTPRSNRQTD